MKDFSQSNEFRPRVPPLPLTAEQQQILEEPLDPRVQKILAEYAEEQRKREGGEADRRIIPFPYRGKIGHAVRDSFGNWTVLPGPPPDEDLAVVI